MIRRRRQIGLVERHAGTMQKDLAADAAHPGAKRPIHLDGIRPGFWIVITHMSPAGVVVKRTADARALRGNRIAVPAQPGEAIPPAHALFDQRETLDLPRFEAWLGAHDFIGRDAYPLLHDGGGRRALSREAREFAHLAADRYDLELSGALPADHAERDGFGRGAPPADLDKFAVVILVQNRDLGAGRRHRPRERGDRRPAITGARGDELLADASGGDDVDRVRQDIARHQPFEVPIDGGRLPAGIGKDCAVGHRPDLPMRGKQRQRGGLHAGTETERTKADRGERSVLPFDNGSVKHQAASRSLSACGCKLWR